MVTKKLITSRLDGGVTLATLLEFEGEAQEKVSAPKKYNSSKHTQQLLFVSLQGEVLWILFQRRLMCVEDERSDEEAQRQPA